mgnify:CR=1 FL=1
MNKSISLVMATYNGEEFLMEQLRSIDDQTLLPNEVIISDDNSTDRTREILENWASRTQIKKVKIVLNSKNDSGCNGNFKNAINFSTGDIVFISDQDDVWFKNKIEVLSKKLLVTEKLILVHDLLYCDKYLKSQGVEKIDRVRNTFGQNVLKDHVTGMAVVANGHFLRIAASCNEVGYAYDNWICDLAYYLGMKGLEEEVYAFYRRHDSNVTQGSILNSNVKDKGVGLVLKRVRSIKRMDYETAILAKERILKVLTINNLIFLKDVGAIDSANLEELKDDIALLILRKQMNDSSMLNIIGMLPTIFVNYKANKYYKIKHILRDVFIRESDV